MAPITTSTVVRLLRLALKNHEEACREQGNGAVYLNVDPDEQITEIEVDDSDPGFLEIKADGEYFIVTVKSA